MRWSQCSSDLVKTICKRQSESPGQRGWPHTRPRGRTRSRAPVKGWKWASVTSPAIPRGISAGYCLLTSGLHIKEQENRLCVQALCPTHVLRWPWSDHF